MDLFYVLNDVLTKKSGGKLHESPDFRSAWSTFMVTRYLSMRDSLVPYAVIMNKFNGTMSQEQSYKWLYANVPKQANAFIKYVSKKKAKKTKGEESDGDQD